MTLVQKYMRRAQISLGALVLVCALAACGAAQEENKLAPTGPIAPQYAGGAGIDQTMIDVCALLPRTAVEAAVGQLRGQPRRSLAIGSEVGCEYTAGQGRGYEVSVYNLDRWELIEHVMNVSPVDGLGDGAFAERPVGGGVALYVLLRDRAVVSARANDADTPQLRALLSLALDRVR